MVIIMKSVDKNLEVKIEKLKTKVYVLINNEKGLNELKVNIEKTIQIVN